MTTGPGVIIATATTSTNWCSFSQLVFGDHAPVQERHDSQSGAEHEGPGLGEEQAICSSVLLSVAAVSAACCTVIGAATADSCPGRKRGLQRTSHTSAPAAMNSEAASDS